MASVPTNAFQRRQAEERNARKRPDHQGKQSIEVDILRVYDVEDLDENGIPDELAPLLLREPGTLFAKVRTLRTQRVFIVGFEESEAQVFSTYGNGMLLEGTRGTITYNGFRPERGRLILRGNRRRALRNNSSDAHLLDISGLL